MGRTFRGWALPADTLGAAVFIQFAIKGKAIDVNLAQVVSVEWGRNPAETPVQPQKVKFNFAGGKKVVVLLSGADAQRVQATLRRTEKPAG